MDTTAISDLGNIGALIGACAAPVTFFAIAFFIRWRTGSFLTVLSRIWTIFHGKTNTSIPYVKQYLDEQAVVMQLIFATGARVRTEQHAKRLIDWSSSNDESLLDAVRCGPYFDWELPGLKRENEQIERNDARVNVGMLLLLLTLASVLFGVMIYDRPLMRMKASGTWFTVTTTAAERFWSSRQLTWSSCAKISEGRVIDTGFSAADTKLLCETFTPTKETDMRAFLQRTLTEQRITAGSLSALCFLLMYLPGKVISIKGHAGAMRKRQAQRNHA
jgi:hypothetical protein